MREGGRVVVVGTRRFRVRLIVAAVEEDILVGVVKWCWKRWEGDAMEVKVEREGGAMARDFEGNRYQSAQLPRTLNT